MYDFKVTLYFMASDKDPQPILVVPDNQWKEILDNWQALMNSIRDLYVTTLEHQEQDTTDSVIFKDFPVLTERQLKLDPNEVRILPSTLLPQEGEVPQ